MKHTKGPWTIDKHPSCDVLYVNIEGGEWPYNEICTIYPGFIEDHRANAELIAKAPAMYDQLASARAIMQKFVAFMDEYYSIGGVIEPLRSDSKEDELLKETYAEMKQWMEEE